MNHVAKKCKCVQLVQEKRTRNKITPYVFIVNQENIFLPELKCKRHFFFLKKCVKENDLVNKLNRALTHSTMNLLGYLKRQRFKCHFLSI